MMQKSLWMLSSSTPGILQALTLRLQFPLPSITLPPKGISCSPKFLP